MKKLYFLVLILLTVLTGWSQTTYYWQPEGSGDWTFASNWNTIPDGGGAVRNTLQPSDILIIDQGGISFTISNVPSQTIGKLSILSGEVTLAGADGTQILTISNGTGTDFSIASGATLIQANSLENIALSGSPTADISGIYQVEGNYNISAGSSVTTVTGAIENFGTITGATTARLIFNGGTYLHGQNGGIVPTATWNAGSVLELPEMTTAYPGGMGQNFRNVVFNGSITDDIVIGNHLNCQENLTINLTHGVGDDLRLTEGNTDRIVTVGGNFNLISGTFSLDHNNNGESELRIAGNFIQTGGTLTETNSSANFSSVIFNGTSVQSFSKTGGTISGNVRFNVNSGATVDFGTSVLNGSTVSFNLANGGKIITSNSQGLSSTGATGSIQVTGTRTYGNGADYEFRGAATGAFSTTGNQVRNLLINSATSNEVTAQRNFVVTGALTLSNGYLTTSAGQLTLGNAATASTSNGAFVNGPMAKNTNTAAAFTFPVGKADGGAGLRTIGIITTNATASTFTAEFFRGASPAGTLAPTLTQKSACEYWDLSRPSGSPARVVLSWAANSSCNSGGYVTELTSLRVAHLTGGVWVDEGNSASTGTATAGSVTSTNAVATFSPFTLASSSATENPLPVIFANVKAFEKNNGVQIEWSNLTEKDVASYSVERSTNGTNYTSIAQQMPTSNQNDKVDYSAFDANPVQGVNYYRIKGIETTGKIVYSKVLTVSLGSANKGLKVYPNPVSGNQVTISLSNVKRGHYTLRVINTAGQDIYKQVINNQGSTLTQTIDLPSVKAGVYNMLIIGNDYRETKTFIVQ